MDVKQLDELFQEYGYEAKEKNASYQVYVLNQGMYHGVRSCSFRRKRCRTNS